MFSFGVQFEVKLRSFCFQGLDRRWIWGSYSVPGSIGDVVGVKTPLRRVAQIVLHGVQVVEVGMQLRVHQDRGVEEDVESQVEVEREEGEIRENHTCMKMVWSEDSKNLSQ